MGHDNGNGIVHGYHKTILNYKGASEASERRVNVEGIQGVQITFLIHHIGQKWRTVPSCIHRIFHAENFTAPSGKASDEGGQNAEVNQGYE